MKGWLVLETGETYQGAWHGGENRAGEVVFNTSHSGYEEIATDPSYFSQIVVMTAPMQGNYGIEDAVWESRKLWIEGFICLEVQDTERDQAWKKRLTDNKIPMLTELDTRHLVLRLRNGGTPWGALVHAKDEEQAKSLAQELIAKKKTLDKDWVYLASRTEPEVRRGDNMVGPRVAVLDFGSKENILRELQNRCSEIKIFNSRSSVQEIMDYNPDGIMLTNGPGDPSDVKVAIGTVKELLGVKPIFGICMGHQILGLALGGKTYKLKFGHRGSNHPIKDVILNQIYMTSQNHGYAVDPATLPDDVNVTHTNLNDGTVAGFYSEKRKCLGIQYHPESCPGPHEASGLFSYFVERMI
ncbi:glutamine-hydrolyzing carbamoyl-phosphate synthase small subunit [Bdellovibrio sp. SKB1291214]|uniref:glutamine-hydrolyzing carbamoyl-phosphate synthase small subunit n=1 Tax=Bdellovibrio sp. SKB1291214 TaxID=1732569 RepID=UPI000B519E27|nr:glutamine-hydrolyzing carbamoyl-phosphate synthase small subunit [Bdellovibrio sp. SKB1291214]UYL08973.1 glutamine-hydrolyzing carbamoyl-phosphate synthase small subunit [Bdellovibrio sp. SKB1291214]